MPDPLLSTVAAALSSFSATSVSSYCSPSTATASGSMSAASYLLSAEETPVRSRLRQGGSLSDLQAPRTNYNFKDDMDVFSPLVDVQPITPSLGNWQDDRGEANKDDLVDEKKSSLFLSSVGRFPYSEGNVDPRPISDWRSCSTSQQDDTHFTAPQLAGTTVASSKDEFHFGASPPGAWGGDALPDRLINPSQPVFSSSHFSYAGSVFAGLQDSSACSSYSVKNSSTSPSLSSLNLHGKVTFSHDIPLRFSESSSAFHSSSVSTSLGTETPAGRADLNFPGTMSSTLPRRFSALAERKNAVSSFADSTSSATGSARSKKTGAETREEVSNNLLPRGDSSAAMGTGRLPAINGVMSQSHWAIPQSTATDQLQGASSSFSLQLVQRTLEDTLGSIRDSIHEDVMSLHIELLGQFHMHEMEMVGVLNSVLEKQDELTKEVQWLRKENLQLRQLL